MDYARWLWRNYSHIDLAYGYITHQCFANKDGLLRAHERIDEIKKTQTDKVEELAAQLNFLKEVQIRMEEKLNLLLDFEKTRFEKVTATTRMRKG